MWLLCDIRWSKPLFVSPKRNVGIEGCAIALIASIATAKKDNKRLIILSVFNFIGILLKDACFLHTRGKKS
jgi:hypothetical protein